MVNMPVFSMERCIEHRAPHMKTGNILFISCGYPHEYREDITSGLIALARMGKYLNGHYGAHIKVVVMYKHTPLDVGAYRVTEGHILGGVEAGSESGRA